MKIGILTYHRAHNYGAMLQAYALSYLLHEMNHEVHFIDYWPTHHAQQYKLIRPIRGASLKEKLINLISDIITLVRRYLRIRKFNHFAYEYLGLTPQVRYEMVNQPIDEQYDCIIVGSDQVWRNRESNGSYIGLDSVYFCQHLTYPTHCIAYAASMGIIDLTSQDLQNLKVYLQAFDTILVRENSLKRLINQLNIPAEVVVDPTLLLSKEQWNMLLPTKRFRSERYVLYYELLQSDEAMSLAQAHAEKMNCKLLVMDAVIHTIPRAGHISYASPIEFVHAIRDAEYIVATSFHGTAFSIIFEKQFITIGLHTNADRVVTLLTHLHLDEHYQPNARAVSAVDYTSVKPHLATIRQRSIQLLTSAINGSCIAPIQQ